MKIVILSPHYPEYALRLADAVGRRHDVTLILDREHLDAEFAGRDPAPLCRRCRVEPIDFRFPGDVLPLLRRLVELQPDVFHLQEASSPKKAFFGLAAVLRLRRRAEIVLTVHDPLPHSGRDADLEPELRLMRRITRRIVDRLVVHGPVCRDELVRVTGRSPDRVFVAPHGVMLADAPTPVASGEVRRFLVFGRMKAYKGLDVLLDAVRRLEAEGRRFAVRIVGAGEELERLDADLRACRSVEIERRWIPGPELAAELAASDAVLMPYRDATQSGVAAVAFGNRRPVVATRVGDIPDVVDDGRNGLLVAPGDAADLAGAMAALIDDPALVVRLGEGASATAAGRLAWDGIADIYETVYAPGAAPARRA